MKTTKANSGATHDDLSSQLGKLFEEQLKDIYWAEKALTKAIPKMIKKASSQELIDALESHLEETEGHVRRAEEVFTVLSKEPKARKCEAMAGLIKEAEEIMEESEEGPMRDAGIIAAAQKVEHYEIATYGGLTQLAKTLGREDIANVLAQTLTEEKETDELLTQIAESDVNYQSAEEEA